MPEIFFDRSLEDCGVLGMPPGVGRAIESGRHRFQCFELKDDIGAKIRSGQPAGIAVNPFIAAPETRGIFHAGFVRVLPEKQPVRELAVVAEPVMVAGQRFVDRLEERPTRLGRHPSRGFDRRPGNQGWLSILGLGEFRHHMLQAVFRS